MNKALPGCLCIAALSAMPSLAHADVWHRALTVTSSIEHDSNPGLADDDAGSVSRLRVSPNYTATGTFGRDEVIAKAGINLERSTDEDLSTNRQDPDLSIGWRRMTETGNFGVRAGYAKSSTRVTELDSTGLVTDDGSRSTAKLQGDWSKALDARNSLTLNGDYQDVSYSSGSYVDYSDIKVGAAWNTQLDERTMRFVNATAGHYAPDRDDIDSSNNFGLMAGVNRKYSEQFDWTAQAGVVRVSGATDDTAFQGSFLLNYKTARSDWSFNIGRSMNPSGEGGYAESDQLKGAWHHDLDDRTQLGADLGWNKYKGTNANTLKQLGVWAGRALTPFWNGRFYIQHRQRDADNGLDASETVVGFSAIYTHPEL